MKNPVLVFAALAASTSFAAVPNVDQSAVTIAQDSQSRLVTVGYTLTGESAVITVDFQTNAVANAETGWTSIGEANFTNTTGDVNQVVPEGEHSICWQPKQSWPDQVIDAGKFRAVVKAWATNAPPDYCAVCLLSDADIQTRQNSDVTFNPVRRCYYVSSNAVPGGVQATQYKTDYLLLRKVPAAGVVWRMGAAGSTSGETYAHRVRLSRDYYIGIYEMTIGQYTTVGGTASGTATKPVGSVTWARLRGTYSSYPWPDSEGNPQHNVATDSILGKLRARSGIDSFDLPTEAQWEYACRAGTGTPYANGGGSASADCKIMGWCQDEVNGVLQSVGLKRPNNWGIYDMHGNVAEWVLDWYADFTAEMAATITDDPIGPATGSQKLWRGGDVYRNYTRHYSYDRWRKKSTTDYDGTTGFRVVCDAVAK